MNQKVMRGVLFGFVVACVGSASISNASGTEKREAKSECEHPRCHMHHRKCCDKQQVCASKCSHCKNHRMNHDEKGRKAVRE